ncbi:hypothetical protein LSH36_549g01075 [Paralvinella palmiformis]|uniref:FZ domain-containing protein n=1 Tax=Paralvinella palmiformis TaxID=53620 RepID=A0AAD9MW06_9ANNE|nr:hypothetical protein LSH36_549g01075 [Paralvinella palmiformis]
MRFQYRRLVAISVLSALLFGVMALPPGGDNEASQPETGYAISESMMYGEPVAFTEDGEFLEYVSEKRRQRTENRARDQNRSRNGSDSKSLPESKRPNAKPQRHVKERTARKVDKYTCVPVMLPMCQGLLAYPLSQYPNVLGHRSEKDARRSLAPFLPLLDDDVCGEPLRKFLCLLVAPQCIGTEDPLTPCRSVCLSAHDRCLASMNRIRISWPEDWACRRYPKDGLCSDLDSQVSPGKQRFAVGSSGIHPGATTIESYPGYIRLCFINSYFLVLF